MPEREIKSKSEAAEYFKNILLGQDDLSLSSKEDLLDALLKWVADHPEDETAFRKLEDPDQLLATIQQYRMLVDEGPEAYQAFLPRLQQTPVRRIRSYFYYTAGIAASLLLIAGAIWWQYHSSKTETINNSALAQVRDVPPGSYKAVVTLGNGSTLILDSLHSGQIGQQGQTHLINHAGGQLSYEVRGSSDAIVYNTVSTGRGGQYRLVLPDGTHVWLDAASSLRFPTAFGGPRREVVLDGQGYFEVVHRKEPFIVHTNRKTDITDLGTSFNISAYPDEITEQATLLEGAVKVTNGGQARLLAPGQQAQVDSLQVMQVRTLKNPNETIAWKDGIFLFRQADLRVAMRAIARWYDVEVEYQGNVPDKKIVGGAPRNENLSVLIQALNTIGVNCRMEGRKIIVLP